MTKRKRKYHCPVCNKVVLRVSDKMWIKSYCEQSGRDTRLQVVK